MTEFEDYSTKFLRWFRAEPKAYLHKDISLLDLRFRDAGRGIVATAEIPADTPLFTISRDSVLTIENSKLSRKLPNLLHDALQQFSEVEDEKVSDREQETGNGGEEEAIPGPWLSLIFVMMYEHLQGAASKWKPYLDILPETFETPMFWTENELENLQGSDLKHRIARETADKIFRRILIPKVKDHADVFYPPSAARLSETELMALAHRMGSTVMSYAFDLGEELNDLSSTDEARSINNMGLSPASFNAAKPTDETPRAALPTSQKDSGVQNASSHDEDLDDASEASDSSALDEWLEDTESALGMVPMADMLNADAEFNARLNHEEETLTMLSIRPIAAGEEILNYYGPLSNAELLRRYGYTSAKHTRYDEVEICGRDLVEVFSKAWRKDGPIVEKIKSLGFDVNRSFVLHRDGGYPNDEGLLISEPGSASIPHDLEASVALLSCLTEAFDYDSWRMDQLDLADQRKIGRIMLENMSQVLDIKLSKYQTSVAEDEQLLSKNTYPRSRLHKAVFVRLGEKKLIQEVRKNTLEMIRKLESFDIHADKPLLADDPAPKRRRLEK